MGGSKKKIKTKKEVKITWEITWVNTDERVEPKGKSRVVPPRGNKEGAAQSRKAKRWVEMQRLNGENQWLPGRKSNM